MEGRGRTDKRGEQEQAHAFLELNVRPSDLANF